MGPRIGTAVRRCDRRATTQRSSTKANPDFTYPATWWVCDETDSGRGFTHIRATRAASAVPDGSRDATRSGPDSSVRPPRPVTATGSTGCHRCRIARCGDDARSISSAIGRHWAQVVAAWPGRYGISGGNRTKSPGIGTVGLQSAKLARPDAYPRVASVRCPPRRRLCVGDPSSCHGRPHPGDAHEEEENTRASSSKPEAHRRTCGGRPRAGRLFVR
jgi:hypothetical protein